MKRVTFEATITVFAAVLLLAAGCTSKGDVVPDTGTDGDVDKADLPDADDAADLVDEQDQDVVEGDTEGEGAGGLTVYDIQNPDSANHPAENSAVSLSGVVVMSERFEVSASLDGFFVSDAEGGAWHGIQVCSATAWR